MNFLLNEKSKFIFTIILFPIFLFVSNIGFSTSGNFTNSNSEYFFLENFSDSTLYSNKIFSTPGKNIWNITDSRGQSNSITKDGSIELGGSQFMQNMVLEKKHLNGNNDYGIDFEINIKSMGNVGHSGRPIAIIIPRSKDESLKNYYAVTYYLENIKLDAIVANMYRCKWAIINTNSPSGMKPIEEGYFILKENINYNGRLSIENTTSGDVKIDFFIDGVTNKNNEYAPLITYIDDSEYKIMDTKTGPAFGTAGFSNDGWGNNPVVRYDNIKLSTINEFNKKTDFINLNYKNNISNISTKKNDRHSKLNYIIHSGIMNLDLKNNSDFNENITIETFIKTIISTENFIENPLEKAYELKLIEKNEFKSSTDKISRYYASKILYRYKNKNSHIKNYEKLIKDSIPKEYMDSVHFSYQENYMFLDNSNKFNGSTYLKKSDLINIVDRLMILTPFLENRPLDIPDIFSSNCVLQRDKKIPVWGIGMSGDTIYVKLKNQIKSTKVKDGKWYLELDPEPAGGPYNMSIRDSANVKSLTGVYVGEVFLIAGQSNAEMYLYECNNSDEVKARHVNKPTLSFFFNKKIMATSPQEQSSGKWLNTENWVLDSSSAIGTFFADELLKVNSDLKKVKIGIIPMTYGGSTIELFLPESTTEKWNFKQKYENFIMSGFWNGFMDYITPYSLKAIIYYQGENSTQLEYYYEKYLRDYLAGLRTEFNNPTLPILLVQISAYGENYYESDIDSWPIIREIQMRVANTMNNVGLVTSIDLADKNIFEIHPKNKKEIGERLAYLAMDMIYENPNSFKSPVVSTYNLLGNVFTLYFNGVDTELTFREDGDQGFEILDEDGKWKIANSKLIGNNRVIEVWNDEIKNPKGFRYAWRNTPKVGVFDLSGLPLLPYNSKKDLFVPLKFDLPTNESRIKIIDHPLYQNDGIVNLTRNNSFRMIDVEGLNNLKHQYAIKDQQPGDSILLLHHRKNIKTLPGTDESKLVILNHRLAKGDWIRNNTRKWTAREVLEVIDQNTVLIDSIVGQTNGDEIELYNAVDRKIAQ